MPDLQKRGAQGLLYDRSQCGRDTNRDRHGKRETTLHLIIEGFEFWISVALEGLPEEAAPSRRFG